MSKVIAVYGKSCVGKSVVAGKLAAVLELPIRHCGEIVKIRAQELGVPKSNLPDYEHEAIDNETRRLALDSRAGIVIEGNFLDCVLREVDNISFILLTCEETERERRFIERSEGKQSTIDLKARDDFDNAHRAKSYEPSVKGAKTLLAIDTTYLEIESIVNRIVKWILEN